MANNLVAKEKAIEWLESKKDGELTLRIGPIPMLKVIRMGAEEQISCRTPNGPCKCVGVDMKEMYQRLRIMDEEDVENICSLEVKDLVLN